MANPMPCKSLEGWCQRQKDDEKRAFPSDSGAEVGLGSRHQNQDPTSGLAAIWENRGEETGDSLRKINFECLDATH